MELTAYRVMLPEDGTHQQVVEIARAAGLPFTAEQAEQALALAKNSSFDDSPALGYVIDMPSADDMKRITERLRGCTRLARQGIGFVPEPDGDRDKLIRMREVLRMCSDAIEGLLEETRCS